MSDSATAAMAELVRLQRTIASWRVQTTSTLRRAILAEVRDEIEARLEVLRDQP